MSTETLQYAYIYIFHVKMMRINGAIVNEDMPIQADLLAVESPMIIQRNNFKVEKEYPESLNVFELVFVDKDHNPYSQCMVPCWSYRRSFALAR